MVRLATPRSKEELEQMVSEIMPHIVDETPYGSLAGKKLDVLLSGRYGSVEHMLQIAHFPTNTQKVVINLMRENKMPPHQVQGFTGLTRGYVLHTVRVARSLGIDIPEYDTRADLRASKRNDVRKTKKAKIIPAFIGSKRIPLRIQEHMANVQDKRPILAPLPNMEPAVHAKPIVVEERKRVEQTMEVKLRVTPTQLKKIMAILEA